MSRDRRSLLSQCCPTLSRFQLGFSYSRNEGRTHVGAYRHRKPVTFAAALLDEGTTEPTMVYGASNGVTRAQEQAR
jgi:hypothetical protein